jgi:hypothetical protein
VNAAKYTCNKGLNLNGHQTDIEPLDQMIGEYIKFVVHLSTSNYNTSIRPEDHLILILYIFLIGLLLSDNDIEHKCISILSQHLM